MTLADAQLNELQPGALGSYCWAHRRDARHVVMCADAIWYFPDPISVPPGLFKIRLFVQKAQMPREMLLRAWRATGSDDRPIGPSEDLDVRLRSIEKNGRVVGYVAVARTQVLGDLYLQLYGQWRDEEKFRVLQDASWTFHIRSY